MRKEIWKILKDLENEKATTNEAYHLLCDLFDVVGRSEQLVCSCDKWHDRMEESNNNCSTCDKPIK